MRRLAGVSLIKKNFEKKYFLLFYFSCMFLLSKLCPKECLAKSPIAVAQESTHRDVLRSMG
jgi:hypothetical protein